jgi:hypothetical protein
LDFSQSSESMTEGYCTYQPTATGQYCIAIVNL